MPGYISHTVMARDTYKKINRKDINPDYMITYSLGGDLCKYSKCRYASHHQDMDTFIYNMADYLKMNNLTKDSELLGVLYGHICHYIMDNTIHPLVRIIDKTCLHNKRNHTLVELYYDAYLTKNILNMRIDKYAKGKLLIAKNNKKVNKMIDYAYKTTYQTNNISRYYKFNLWLYRKIKYLYYLLGYKLLRKITGIDKFLNNNKNVDLINKNNLIIYKDYQKKECHDDLITSYHISLNRALAYISDIDKYLKIWQMFGFMIRY